MFHQKRAVPHQRPIPHTFLSEFRDRLTTYLDPDNPKHQYLAGEIFRKYCAPDSGSTRKRREAAITKWLSQEELNRKTNHRLIVSDATFSDRVTWDDILSLTRCYIEQTIGQCPPPDWEYMGSFSNGASYSLRRSPLAVPTKYVQGTDVTREALVAAVTAVCRAPLWTPLLQSMTAVRGNALFTVPKSSEIDRCAAKEPSLNMYLQKALGDVIRRSLKAHGVDLNDQSVNQRLALKGSLDGSLATVDLSAASDSMTSSLVAALLPPGWFVTLDSVRSKETLIPRVGKSSEHWHYNQMFSSMGNGFTFELESLIFWALTRAVCSLFHYPGTINVYGDDIICPSQAVGILRQVFGYAGFRVNTKKTHSSGPFRESCGKHYYSGVDVSPFYVRGPITDLTQVIKLANQLREWLTREFIVTHDPKGYELWYWVISHIPRSLRGGGLYERTDVCVYPGLTPSHRLTRRVRSRRISEVLGDDTGGYLFWHDCHEGNSSLVARPYDYETRMSWIVDLDTFADVKTAVSAASFLVEGKLKYSRIRKDENWLFGQCSKLFTHEC